MSARTQSLSGLTLYTCQLSQSSRYRHAIRHFH